MTPRASGVGALVWMLAFAAAPPRGSGAETVRHGCGTPRPFARIAPSSSAMPGTAARVAGTTEAPAESVPGRVMITPHFVIHYTLARNVHQPVWTSADAALKHTRDSLHTAFTGDTAMRATWINAQLDSLGAPHPAFVRQAAAYFEKAYAYYVDTLGMVPTDSNKARYFRGTIPGKYNVEIGDIQVLEGEPRNFGVTFPPKKIPGSSKYYSAHMLIDNDFLYNAGVNGSGTVTGTPIVNAVTHVNYNTDWDKGLAVTIAHEYYHGVQLKYTPDYKGGFHAWFELGAVAMEERLAPAVNDYLSYLTSLLPLKTPVSLYASGLYNDDYEGNYANGIFHIFLSHSLGNAFDVSIWETLRANENNLPAALLANLGGQARWDSLYAAYAASLAIAGQPGSAASPLAFSPDFALWPKPYLNSAPAKDTVLSLEPLTYRLIAPVPSAVTVASYPGIKGAWRVSPSGTGFTSQFLADSTARLYPTGAPTLAVANSSFTTARILTLKPRVLSTGIAAFPNPARLTAAGSAPGPVSIQFDAPAGGETAPLYVTSESGKRIATLPAALAGSFWTWNLRDPQNRAIPPGVYYYGITGRPPQTLLVLP